MPAFWEKKKKNGAIAPPAGVIKSLNTRLHSNGEMAKSLKSALLLFLSLLFYQIKLLLVKNVYRGEASKVSHLYRKVLLLLYGASWMQSLIQDIGTGMNTCKQVAET